MTTAPADEEPSLVKLKEVNGLGIGQLVTVIVKVMDVGAPEKVKTKEGKDLTKQKCKICDESGCVRLVLWEKDVGAVEEEESYKLIGIGVCAYGSRNFLSLGVNCIIEKVDDISEVTENDSDDEDGGIVKRVVVGEIDAVLSAEEYLGCLCCNGKMKNVNEVVGECPKCGSLVKTMKCMKKMMAKVVISGDDGEEHTVTMFNEIIVTLIDGVAGDGPVMKLLMAERHQFTIDGHNVVLLVKEE